MLVENTFRLSNPIILLRPIGDDTKDCYG